MFELVSKPVLQAKISFCDILRYFEIYKICALLPRFTQFLKIHSQFFKYIHQIVDNSWSNFGNINRIAANVLRNVGRFSYLNSTIFIIIYNFKKVYYDHRVIHIFICSQNMLSCSTYVGVPYDSNIFYIFHF